MLNSPSGVQTEKVDGAIDQADKGLQLIEIFHRMVPPNLFKAATEGQLLGLIFFGLLFGFFISVSNLKQGKHKLHFGRSQRGHSFDNQMDHLFRPNWSFWSRHSNPYASWSRYA